LIFIDLTFPPAVDHILRIDVEGLGRENDLVASFEQLLDHSQRTLLGFSEGVVITEMDDIGVGEFVDELIDGDGSDGALGCLFVGRSPAR